LIKTLWFDGESAAAHGLMISGSGTFDAAERDVEVVSIPGRSGDLIIDNGRYKNIPISYPASISTDFPGKAEAVRNWLGSRVGYCRLEDDYDPDHFRLARFQGPLRFTPGFLNRTAECTLTFDCKPQRWLKSGEYPISVTDKTVLWNLTGYPAAPVIRIEGTDGSICEVILKNDAEAEMDAYLTIPSGNSGNICLDCESGRVYVDVNGVAVPVSATYAETSHRLPVLRPGYTQFAVYEISGSVTKVEIIPRWWTL